MDQTRPVIITTSHESEGQIQSFSVVEDQEKAWDLHNEASQLENALDNSPPEERPLPSLPPPPRPTKAPARHTKKLNTVFQQSTYLPPPASINDADLYSNLATFTFGSPASSPTGSSPGHSPFAAGSPIDPTDRTPRPSISPDNPMSPRFLASTSSHINPNSYTEPKDNPPPPDDYYTSERHVFVASKRHRRHSDAESVHTFGPGGNSEFDQSSRSESRASSSNDPEFSSEDEVEVESDMHHEYSQPTTTSQPSEERRGSLPMNVPNFGVGSVERDRTGSILTLRRPSRSLDDDLCIMKISETSTSAPSMKTDPLFRTNWRMVESSTSNEPDIYAGLDLKYILNESPNGGPRRQSLAPSFQHSESTSIHPRNSSTFKFSSWAPNAWSVGGRRPSTATIGTMNDDTFARYVKRYDDVYEERRLQWSFKKEMADAGPSASGLLHNRQGGTPSLAPPEQINRKESQRSKIQGMQPGQQQIWRNTMVGRYKVDRIDMPNTTAPHKPPQQRLQVRHIPDPFSAGNPRGGPGAIVHKHSKAIAFSLFRVHGLFSPATRAKSGQLSSNLQGRSHVNTANGIMLAPRRVQEQYTSTHTTSKLTTHGLLGDTKSKEQRRRDGSNGRARRRRTSAILANSEPSAKRVSKARSQGELSNRANASQASSSIAVKTLPSSSVIEDKMKTKSPSAFDDVQSPQPTKKSSVATINTVETSQSSTSTQVEATSTDEEDDQDHDQDEDLGPSPLPTRTPHAEAFATLDPTHIEYVRAKSAKRPIGQDSRVPWYRRLVGKHDTARAGFPHSVSTAAVEATFTPPWLVIADRQAQEDNEQLVNNLSNSFKDVGLLHSVPRNRGTKPRPKAKSELLSPVPDECLYMLVPLWPGETDEPGDATAVNVALEERQFVLVYYVPFDERNPEKAMELILTQQKSTSSSDVISSRSINISAFSVCARLVGAPELRGSGIRLPEVGLAVSGPMSEAIKAVPATSVRAEYPDNLVMGVCYGRNLGMEFIPESLVKLGLCLPLPPPTPYDPDRPDASEDELVCHLSSIGRAVVEMAWLGCMAVTSFAE